MGDFLLESFVPGLGALVSLLMYGAPLSAVLKAASSRSLGDLNAIPFSITIANTIIWLSYGLLKHDPFITTPNAPGVCLAVFCTMTTYGLADETVKSRMRMILCGQAVLLPLLGVLTAFACSNLTEQLSLWGLSGNAISLVYYGAPLSTMAEVIKTRNSASILLPLTLMNLVNALLWTTYGMAIGDVYVWAPNGVGALLSVAQVALSLIYPSKPKSISTGGLDLSDYEEHEPLKGPSSL